MSSIEANDLTKRFGQFTAVELRGFDPRLGRGNKGRGRMGGVVGGTGLEPVTSCV
jgi:hypothetical protein